METNEAFPNAKHIFTLAFAAQDPAPVLLQIIKDHPNYITLYDLIFYYTQAVENDPYRAKSLASALARLSNSPDAPSIENDTLKAIFAYELGNYHFKVAYDTSNAGKVYGPRSQHLIHSLLSGFSFKYDLCSSPEMSVSMENGWNAPLGSSEASELSVVGACIQLLIHGYAITTESAGTYRRQPEMVAKKLKAHMMAGTVKDPLGIEVLEVHYYFLKIFLKKCTNFNITYYV